MKIREKITQLRKEKLFFQTYLAEVIKASGEAIPSVEVAKKIADVFKMTIDFLIGNNHNLAVDKKTLKRMQDIDKLDDSTKRKIIFPH